MLYHNYINRETAKTKGCKEQQKTHTLVSDYSFRQGIVSGVVCRCESTQFSQNRGSKVAAQKCGKANPDSHGYKPASKSRNALKKDSRKDTKKINF